MFLGKCKVMEDKRIMKTKKNLKNTLLELLDEKPFEKISVTELCQRANTSRITFYTYYGDKYELLDEFFRDLKAGASNRFNELQKQNNPEDEPVKSYQNLLDAILDMYYGHFDFFQHTKPQESPDLMFSYYWYVIQSVESFEIKYADQLKPKYPIKQVSAFLATGMWGFAHMGDVTHQSQDKVRSDAKALLGNLLEGEIFTREN